MNPAVSPNGKLIAFSRCPALYICDVCFQPLGPEGTPRAEPQRLIRQSSSIRGLAWSRDGGSIIYSAARFVNMKSYLWRVGINSGSPPIRLEYAGPYATFPAVAPLKNRLAFAYSSSAQDIDIWRIREGENPKAFIASSVVDRAAEFSPDGRKVVFASDRAGETSDIWIANADGSEPAQLTHEDGAAGSPRWSPDGRSIAFDLHIPEGEIDLYMVKAIGGPIQRLTREPTQESLPSFSRDGLWIYFNSNRSGERQIWRMPAGGGEARQITQNGADVALESFDGQTLYFSRGLSLFAMPVVGGAEQKIADLGHSRTFAVTGEGIYYIGRQRSDRRYELSLLDPLTSKARVLAVLDGPFSQGLTVSPDRKTILYSRYKEATSDLMLIENFR